MGTVKKNSFFPELSSLADRLLHCSHYLTAEPIIRSSSLAWLWAVRMAEERWGHGGQRESLGGPNTGREHPSCYRSPHGPWTFTLFGLFLASCPGGEPAGTTPAEESQPGPLTHNGKASCRKNQGFLMCFCSSQSTDQLVYHYLFMYYVLIIKSVLDSY